MLETLELSCISRGFLPCSVAKMLCSYMDAALLHCRDLEEGLERVWTCCNLVKDSEQALQQSGI